jgi:hypothetical protein
LGSPRAEDQFVAMLGTLSSSIIKNRWSESGKNKQTTDEFLAGELNLSKLSNVRFSAPC